MGGGGNARFPHFYINFSTVPSPLKPLKFNFPTKSATPATLVDTQSITVADGRFSCHPSATSYFVILSAEHRVILSIAKEDITMKLPHNQPHTPKEANPSLNP